MVEPRAELGCRRGRLGGAAPEFCTGEMLLTQIRETERGWNQGLFPSHGEESGGGSAALWFRLGASFSSCCAPSPHELPGLSCLACFLTVAEWLVPLQHHMDRAGRRGGPKGQPPVLVSMCLWDPTGDFHLCVMEGEAKVGTSPPEQGGRYWAAHSTGLASTWES